MAWMIISKRVSIYVLLLFLVSCVKHDASSPLFVPVSQFTGRLLVMDHSQRFQVEVDWKGDERQGNLRLTHALSGRIVDIIWLEKEMVWRDNRQSASWRMLSEKGLVEMGIAFPPWTLARVFTGKVPQTMKTTDNRNWKGSWEGRELRIRWASNQQRVELSEIKTGRKAVVVFND